MLTGFLNTKLACVWRAANRQGPSPVSTLRIVGWPCVSLWMSAGVEGLHFALGDRGNTWNRSLGATVLRWTLVLYSFLSNDEKEEIWKGEAFVASPIVDQTVNFSQLHQRNGLRKKRILSGQE